MTTTPNYSDDRSRLVRMSKAILKRSADLAARSAECTVVTLSGFTTTIRQADSGTTISSCRQHNVGCVEIGHLTLCHLMLAFSCANCAQDYIKLAKGVAA